MNSVAQMFRRYKITIIPALILLIAAPYLYLRLSNNFHPITPGEAYRSAQLGSEHLEKYIKQYGIKSVLNLRDENPNDAPWYKDEVNTGAKNNIVHYDVALSAKREPTSQDVKKLMEIFKTAPRPILIHCKAGSDRSGLVAAMWKVVVDKETKPEAEKQLSLLFGHLPFGQTAAMDRFFNNWKPELD